MMSGLVCRGWRFKALPLLALLFTLLAACSTSAAPRAAAGTILASTSASMDDAFPLDGQRVTGSILVFVAEGSGGLDYVEFKLRNADGDVVLRNRDYEAPYTPTRDGGPLDLNAFAPGKLVLQASTALTDGTVVRGQAEFEVAEASTEPEPTDPKPTDPEPTDPEPTDPEPTDPKPTDPKPTDPEPTDPEPEPTPPSPSKPAPTPDPVVPGTGIWQPRPGTSWQWQLSGKLDTSVNADVYDVDLENTSASTIAQLHSQGRRVICYISAGTYEPGRGDASKFPESVKGKKMEDWNELWLDIRNITALAPVMLARMDSAVAKGCDALEPDNIDGYNNNTGFPLKAADQLAYNRWLANSAHERGLAIGLKNDLEQVKDLVDYFDFAINEECFSYGECDLLLPFIRADKAVFGAEYELRTSSFCSQANSMNMDFILKNWDLDAYREACR